jgi:hypothetical protein
MEDEAHDSCGDDGVGEVEIPSEPELFEDGEGLEVGTRVEQTLVYLVLDAELFPGVG